MTDTNLRWIPRFDFASSSVEFTYPITPWTPGERNEGSMQRTGTGSPGVVQRYKKYTLAFTLRFLEDEWDNVIGLIAWAQNGREITWFPRSHDDTTATSILCFLESPHVKDEVRPQRDAQLPWLLTLPIVLVKDTPWEEQYFNTFDEGGSEPPVTPTGTAYIVTSEDYFVAPGGTMEIAAQLVDDDENPVLEPGHVVTWSKTGSGGTFDNPTSITDINGIATVNFTGSAVLDTIHKVIATDENDATGESDPITMATDGLTLVRAIGDCELLVDAISGVTGNGTFATAITDLSGNGHTITLPGTDANKPRFTATEWDGSVPCLRFDKSNTQRFHWTLGASLAQPFTYVIVLDNYAQSGAFNQDILNAGDNDNVGAISYAGALGWRMYAGTDAATGFGLLSGKRMRTDEWNGANSKCYHGGTASATLSIGSLGIQNATNGVGGRPDGLSTINGKIAAIVIYSKVLTAQNRADLLAFFQARYPGVQS